MATVAGTSSTYHHPDHLSNRAETDANGNTTRTFGHFPFGEVWYETGTADEWKFTSYERDSLSGETGLDYAQFRRYSSGLGRFITADFISGSIGDPQSLNRYAYVRGDPVSLTDPLGLYWNCTFEIVTVTFNGDSEQGFTVVCEEDGDNGLDSGFGVGGGGGSLPGDPCFGGPCGGGGGGGGGGGTGAQQQPVDLWEFCLENYGTDNAKAHMTVQNYNRAKQAAGQTGVDLSAILTIIDMETSFVPAHYWVPGPAGDIGPMQVTPVAAADTRRVFGQSAVFKNYRTNFYSNLIAGANYVRALTDHYGVDFDDIGFAYKGGPKMTLAGNSTPGSRNEEAKWASRQPKYAQLVNCLEGKE